MKQALLGYQVYSAREEAAKDLGGVLKKLAAMGYDGVELAGTYDCSPAEVKAMADDACLVVISDHVPIMAGPVQENMFQVVADHITMGCEYIAIPYIGGEYAAGQKSFAKALRTIYDFGTLCLQGGIQLLYHNHDFEFKKFSEQYALDFLYDAIPEDLLQTELDTCWVKYAGEDPVAYIRKYEGRCPVVHMKDYIGTKLEGHNPYALIGGAGEASADVPFMFKPMGYGCQDVKAIVEAALDSGTEWFIVEQDASTERTPLEDAKLSADTMNALLEF